MVHLNHSIPIPISLYFLNIPRERIVVEPVYHVPPSVATPAVKRVAPSDWMLCLQLRSETSQTPYPLENPSSAVRDSISPRLKKDQILWLWHDMIEPP